MLKDIAILPLMNLLLERRLLKLLRQRTDNKYEVCSKLHRVNNYRYHYDYEVCKVCK